MMEENEQLVSSDDSPHNNSNNSLMIGVFAVIALLVVGYIVMNKQNSNDEKTETVASETMPVNSGTDSDMAQSVEGASTSGNVVSTENGVATVTMDAGSFYYKPNQITVKKGSKVKVMLTSRDMMHNFNIDEFKVKSPLVKAGETSTVEFTADKAGSFEFYCSVGQHRKNGQVGTLTVTE